MAFTFNTQLQKIASAYLNSLKLNISVEHLNQLLEENPYYPSLYSLSETFNILKISNKGVRISREEISAISIEEPFLAFYNVPGFGSDFILIEKFTEKEVIYLHKKKIKVSKAEFCQNFLEVVWFAEINNSMEALDVCEFRNVRRKKNLIDFFKLASTILLFALLIAINLPTIFQIQYLLIVFFSTIGLLLSIFLNLMELKANVSFVNKICSLGGKLDCDAVLNSKASKIFGVSWGQIGFIYFAFYLIFLLFPNVDLLSKFKILSISNLISFFYVFFSLFYQWKIIKQWCTLCLGVQAILILNLMWTFWVSWSFEEPIQDFSKLSFSLVFSFALPIVVFTYLLPIYRSHLSLSLYRPAYVRIKSNPSVFDSLLIQQDKLPNGWQNIGINLGNPNASNVLIKVCNPFCKPCSESHQKLIKYDLLNTNICLKIIYVGNNNENSSDVIMHLLEIADNFNEEYTLKAVNDWYLNVNKNYHIFKKRHPVIIKNKVQINKISEMSEWCRQAGVIATPTFFFNGFKMPEDYDIEDLFKVLLHTKN